MEAEILWYLVRSYVISRDSLRRPINGLRCCCCHRCSRLPPVSAFRLWLHSLTPISPLTFWVLKKLCLMVLQNHDQRIHLFCYSVVWCWQYACDNFSRSLPLCVFGKCMSRIFNVYIVYEQPMAATFKVPPSHVSTFSSCSSALWVILLQ